MSNPARWEDREDYILAIERGTSGASTLAWRSAPRSCVTRSEASSSSGAGRRRHGLHAGVLRHRAGTIVTGSGGARR